MNRSALILPLLAVALGSCGGKRSALGKVEQALVRLHACKTGQEESDVLDSLKEIKISREVGDRLLRAAAESYPDLNGRPSETNAGLLRLLWKKAGAGHRATITEVYDKLDGKYEARESALRILTEMEDPGARSQVIELLKRPSSRTVTFSWVFVPWKPERSLSKDLFPGLLEAAPGLRNASGIYSLSLDFVQGGFLNVNEHSAFVAHVVERSKKILEAQREAFRKQVLFLDQLDSPPEESLVPEDVQEDFNQLEILLDLLGSTSAPSAEPVLRSALREPSYRLKVFAVCSLLVRKEAVEPSILDGLAAEPASRGLLWLCFTKRALESRFPEKYRAQKALAEADLVQWLQFPTELGKVPKEIRLLAVIRTVEEGKRQLLYFFIFRHPTFKEGKWLVGVSGPFEEGKANASSGGSTFSRFETLDSKSLEGHIKEYTESGYKILERNEPPKGP